MKQIFPKNKTVPIESAYTDLHLRDRPPQRRPYVVLNMVSSVDGRAIVEGRTKLLGSDVDRTLFLQLRTQVDAVLAGTRTVKVENYGRLVRRPELADLRRKKGLAPQPLAVMVSRSMQLPLDAPLFHDPESRVVVFTNSQEEDRDLPKNVEVVHTGSGDLSLANIFASLRADFDVQTLLIEGGPTINAAVLAEGLADELFLTLSPKLVGGRDPLTIVAGDIDTDAVELELVSALTNASFLFLRYKIAAEAPS